MPKQIAGIDVLKVTDYKDGKITLGACSYDTLVIPKAIVIDKTTDDILRNMGMMILIRHFDKYIFYSFHQ